jgi:branched-chain amino acid transport system substrate-binding protein
MILLDAWAAADAIIDNGQAPNYCFRLSLKDSWAVETMLSYAAKKGLKRIGVLLPTTGWGRSNEKAIKAYVLSHPEMSAATFQWFMWGDKFLLDKYEAARDADSEVIFFVTNEAEGAILVKEVAALPIEKRLPVICHWGITGSDFTKLCGDALNQVDLTVVQTYSFFDNKREEKLKQFFQTADKLFNISKPEDIPSPVGMAHAYDLTHILALAVNKAGNTNRSAIRDALEQVRDYDGLIKHYPQPFTSERHEALDASDVFMSRYQSNGHLRRIKE